MRIRTAETKQREKNFKKQLKMVESMPGNASVLMKIDRLHKMFSDLDQDGMLTFSEFPPGAADPGFGEMWEEQQDAFNAMDKDGGGKVNFEDMERSSGKSDEEWKTTSKWNNEDVNLWLSHIGVDQYAEEFDNVKDWGVQKNAHVHKMMREIKDLKAHDDLLGRVQFEKEALKSELDNVHTPGARGEVRVGADCELYLQQRQAHLPGEPQRVDECRGAQRVAVCVARLGAGAVGLWRGRQCAVQGAPERVGGVRHFALSPTVRAAAQHIQGVPLVLQILISW